MFANRHKPVFLNPQRVIDLALFAAALGLYSLTLAPSVLPADSGEFQLVTWKLGVAHPPGYPLYTLAGFLFSRLFASPAYALNLLSAVLASITLVFVSRAVRAATGSIVGGLAAAAILGTSTTFWAQATTANIRMPTALFTAWCVHALVSFRRSIAGNETARASAYPPRPAEVGGISRCRSDRHLATFAIVFSLGLGHHPSLLFPGIFFIIYLIGADPSLLKQPRRWLKPALGFLLGSLILLYLPIRGATGGTLADGEATAYLAQPDKFLDHVLARGFEGDFFYFVNTRPDLLGDRIALLPTLFDFQFNLGVLLFGVLGVIALAWRNARLLVLLLGGIVVHTLVALAYRAPQTVEYMLPAYVLFATLIGCGIASVAPAAARRPPAFADPRPKGPRAGGGWQAAKDAPPTFVTWGLALLALATGAARGLDNLPSYAWLAQHEDTRDTAGSLLSDAPPDAIILSNWHWANPMWYLQQVEGLRPDVSVVYVFPRGEPLAASWLNGIAESLATGRPVVIDMLFPEEFAAAPYIFEPISREAFLVRESPRADAPSGFTPLTADLGQQFQLLGYRMLDGRTSPAEPLTLFLAWRVEAQPDRDYSFFVHLVEPAGRVIGQSDRTPPTTRYKPGAVIVERFSVAPLPNVTPGDYSLVTGAYSVENGSVVQLSGPVQLTEATVQATSRLTSLPAGSAIALAHGLYFLNAAPTSPISNALVPGSRLTLDLRFAATRPLTRDFVVSVQILGQGQAWKATSDSVPALGAIPTLKWIAGSGVVDRHVIDIPRDAQPGPATVSLILYDNFTRQPLALLDEQLIQRGQSIPLGTVTLATP